MCVKVDMSQLLTGWTSVIILTSGQVSFQRYSYFMCLQNAAKHQTQVA